MKKSKLKIILISLIALVILSGIILLILEKSGITNLYTSTTNNTVTTQQQTGEIPSANPTNTVDYSPPSETDETTQPDKISESTPSESVNTDLNAIITSTRKNSSGDSYLIKVAVNGTTGGTCDVVLSKGELSVTDSGTIGLSADQYSCLDLSVPSSSLTQAGTWNVDVTVTDSNGATTSTTSTMEVII